VKIRQNNIFLFLYCFTKNLYENLSRKNLQSKKSPIWYPDILLFRSRPPALNFAILCESNTRFNLQDHSLNLLSHPKLILTYISHVGYLSPSKGKFLEFLRHYSYHELTKDCIRIFMLTLCHTQNSLKNYLWCDFSYWVQQTQLSTHYMLNIVIKDFILSFRN
jgi:hypothetical protein